MVQEAEWTMYTDEKWVSLQTANRFTSHSLTLDWTTQEIILAKHPTANTNFIQITFTNISTNDAVSIWATALSLVPMSAWTTKTYPVMKMDSIFVSWTDTNVLYYEITYI